MSEDRVTINSEDVMVRMQPTPNPYALKFITNQALKAEGKATFQHPTEAQELPLIASLFDVQGVLQVYVYQNTLTITHTGELDSDDMENSVTSVLKTRLPIHNPAFSTPDEAEEERRPTVDRSNLSKEMQEIENILDRTIRPGLQADGGDLDVISLEDNELKILYQGACGGCPSAMMGTLDAIQGILRQELDNPELKVRPI